MPNLLDKMTKESKEILSLNQDSSNTTEKSNQQMQSQLETGANLQNLENLIKKQSRTIATF